MVDYQQEDTGYTSTYGPDDEAGEMGSDLTALSKRHGLSPSSHSGSTQVLDAVAELLERQEKFAEEMLRLQRKANEIQ
jgi:hypothetical protein